MQLQPMPDQSRLVAAYGEAESEAYIEEEAGQRASARRALERIELYAPERGALLDLGCWVGFLLAEARERGWRTLGVEPSRFASGYARGHLRLEVITGELFTASLPPASFQAVTMGDVIEHLTDPGGALDHVRKLLAPGGVVWLALPDAGSRVARVLRRRWWSVLPTHVQYFTRRSISSLLSRGGFEVLEIATAPKAFTVRYYLGRIRGYSPRLSTALVRTAAAVGVADRLWAPDFRDRMAVIARAERPQPAARRPAVG
jgi:SAM-dependent methyltransferase